MTVSLLKLHAICPVVPARLRRCQGFGAGDGRSFLRLEATTLGKVKQREEAVEVLGGKELSLGGGDREELTSGMANRL